MAQMQSKGYVQRSRDRIRAGMILGNLIKCHNGEMELTQQQVNIGLALLKKVLPDTSHQVIETSLDARSDREITVSELYQDVISREKG
jgi:hypothetical protein